MSRLGEEEEAMQGSHTPVRFRREQTYPYSAGREEGLAPPDDSMQRRLRPRSASYVALRSAVYQLTCLNDFNLEKIGSGFFADVYKVKHKTNGEVMVLKMNKCRTNSRKMLSEIQLMNRLSHPNILKFRGSCVHEGQLHALTEYINGGSLGTWLLNSNIELSWSQRVKIARDIARGMAYLHSKGVFHRDLNSSNCLIQKHPGGRLKTVVADFGLAAKIKQRRIRSHTEIVGSPYWMAPECLHGQSYCEQADMFSFGITLAEIVTRVSADPEFMPRTKQFGMDFQALREMCPDCPQKLFDIMEGCCQLDPDDRPTFEDIVKILDSIPLDDDDEDTSEKDASRENRTDHHEEETEKQDTNVLSPTTGEPIDLRSCVSEPFLRLQDSNEDLGFSTEYSLHSRLDSTSSLATSTEASSSGSSGCGQRILEEDDCEFSLISSAGQNNAVPVVNESSGEIDQSESLKTAYSESAQRPISSDVASKDESSCSSSLAAEEDGCCPLPDLKAIGRRSSEGDLKLNRSSVEDVGPIPRQRVSRKLRHPMIKSISLNTSNEQESSPLSSGRLDPLRSNALNSSMQTLVGDEADGNLKVDAFGGGGDSGIDPGEAEVFKFPPKIESCDREESANGIGTGIGEEGDLTPLCTSPTFMAGAKTSALRGNNLANSIVSGSRIDELQLDEEPLPISHHYTTPNGDLFHDLFVTPYRRSSSPNAQSCASSEFSFCLPSPSFPWAPPTSPTPLQSQSKSLPTTPTHRKHSSSRNHFRYSQEISSHQYSAAVYPMTYFPDSRITDYDSHQPDAVKSQTFNGRGSGEKLHRDSAHLPVKTVHFLPVDVGHDVRKRLEDDFLDSSLDCESYKVIHRRSRSHSNPAHALTKQSSFGSGNYSLTYARSPPENSGEAESNQARGVPTTSCHANHTTQQFKCYNIRLRRGVRLSNSTPNLPSVLSLRSTVL